MATTKKRIVVSLPKTVDKALKVLAKRDQVPHATKAVHLLQLALEIEEDQVWNEIAQERDKRGAKFVSHDKAWS